MTRGGWGWRGGKAALVWGVVSGIALPVFQTRVALATEATSASPSAAVTAPTASAAVMLSKAGIFVELHADDPKTRIYRIAPATGVATPVCRAPCRKMLDRDATYVIDGEGIATTSAFTLPDDADEILLEVEAGSSTKRWVGGAMEVAGGASIVGGLYVLLTSGMGGVRPQSGEPDPRASDARFAYVAMVAGFIPLVVGQILLHTGRTSVITSNGAAFTSRPAPAGATPRIALTPRGLVF